MSDLDFLRIVFMLGEVYGSLYQEEFRDRYRLNQIGKMKSFIEEKVKDCKACKGLGFIERVDDSETIFCPTCIGAEYV